MSAMVMRVLASIPKTRGLFHRLPVRQSSTSSEVPPSNENSPSDAAIKLGGFAAAFQKQTAEIEARNAPPLPDTRDFATLLRSSKFVDLGDPKGKIVQGEIINIVEDDLYIDFGWKFHCVCPKPLKNSEEYVIGAKVRLMVNDLELSTRFLGSETDLTILEADCRLLNIIYSPVRRN